MGPISSISDPHCHTACLYPTLSACLSVYSSASSA